ncbi:MAG: SEL1-like repeat protein [Clostridia bacterium]|nr:SEL1-like repeat protein [Clostridia bacterium]
MANEVELYNIGYCYYTGTNDYPLNKRKAFEYFRQSAELGHSDAMNYLGIYYRSGEFVSTDKRMAATWFSKALDANEKNPFPAYNLALMYHNGEGIPQDKEKAYHLALSAVKNGRAANDIYANACFLVGVILMEYYDNTPEAFPYFEAAAKCGNLRAAWHNVGHCYENGYGVQKSLQNAYASYRKAAELGFAQSMDACGRILILHGSKEEGRMWITKAAKLGYQPAIKRLKALNVADGNGSLWDLF